MPFRDFFGDNSLVFNSDNINKISFSDIGRLNNYKNSLRPVVECDLTNFDNYFQDILDIQHYPLPIYDVNGVENIFIFYTYNA